MGKEFLRKLGNVYKQPEQKPDAFGRKPVTPAEVIRWIEHQQEPTEADYPPTEADIAEKGD